MKVIKLQKDQKLTIEQAKNLFGSASIDEQRLNIKTQGPWSVIIKCSGLCMHTDFETGEHTIYGQRTLTNIRQNGYELEGWVSIGGKKCSAFTSSHLFELENGHLISVGTIFPRVNP